MAHYGKDRWLRYVPGPDNPFAGMIYGSSVRGITQEETGEEIAYWGKLLHFPRHSTTPDDRLEAVNFLTLAREIPEHDQPIQGGMVEGYEFIDVDSGDVVMVLRLPCRSSREAPPGNWRDQLRENPFSAGVFYSVSDASTGTDVTDGRVYWGKVIVVPDEVMGIPGGMKPYEVSPISVLEQIPEPGKVPSDGWVERYEVWDIDTGDLIIFWRIPSQPGKTEK